jgi:hypothetical protein
MALKGARLNSKWQNPYLAVSVFPINSCTPGLQQKLSLAIFGMVFLFSLPTLMVHEVIEYPHDGKFALNV